MTNPSHEAAAPAPGYLYQSKWPLVELVARSRRQPDIEVPSRRLQRRSSPLSGGRLSSSPDARRRHPSSMRLVGSGDDLERRGNVSELFVRQPAGVMLPNAAQVCLSGAPQDLASVLRQPSQHGARVMAQAIPVDKALADEPVDPAGKRAGRRHDPPRELSHLERVVRRTRKSQQDVVGLERDPVLGAEFGAQLSCHLVMGVEKGLPGAQLMLAQLGLHGLHSIGRLLAAARTAEYATTTCKDCI